MQLQNLKNFFYGNSSLVMAQPNTNKTAQSFAQQSLATPQMQQSFATPQMRQELDQWYKRFEYKEQQILLLKDQQHQH